MADLYYEPDQQGLIAIILVGYSVAEKVEYISSKRLPGLTSLSDAAPLIDELIQNYRLACETMSP